MPRVPSPVKPTLLALAAAVLLTPAAAPAAVPYGERPMDLPRGPAAAASPSTWIVGARESARTRDLARAHRARRAGAGVYTVARTRAAALAAGLRRAGLLRYAEADVALRRASALDAHLAGWARGAVVPPPAVLAPPAPTVPIGVLDDPVDAAHPDLGPITRFVNTAPLTGNHGTMVASAAAALNQGTGVAGVLPGNPLLSYGVGEEISCADVSTGIDRLVDAGAKVVNLSMGATEDCFALFEAVQVAYARGVLVVASVGNEFQDGNPVTYPAAYPHVLSVAAVGPDFRASFFSNENIAVDLAAPGEAVPVATPVSMDTDGSPDGVTLADGTSFAAPMVAGAAAWMFAARPGLSQGQVADVLRRGARDVGPQGYDAGTGYGVLDLPRSLSHPTPADDPLEPNDGITFVDGTVFAKPDAPVWRGQGKRLVRAAVDVVEDPVDVYRVVIPARAAFSVLLRPNSGGDVDLDVFDRTARTLSDRKVARSRRGPGRTDTARVVNPSSRARTAYVAVRAQPEPRLDTSYRLELRRTKRR